jgi:DNA-binding PadR family transcriptional regulator
MPDYLRRRPAEQHLPLTVPVFQILLALADQDLHGYAIIQDIRQRTDGEVDLTASTLYAAIKRLLDSRLIDELATRPHAAGDDPRRRYYRITALGREVARLETERLERTLRLARRKRLALRKV